MRTVSISSLYRLRWADLFETALDLLTEVDDALAWQRSQASRQITDATAHSGELMVSP